MQFILTKKETQEISEMRSFTVLILLSLFLASPLAAQERVTERKTTKDSASGDVTVTESVIVRTTEDVTPRNNMIILNPLKFFLFYNLSYFHRLNDVTVIGGGLQIPTPSGVSGIGFNLEARFHPSGKALRGFYIAPNISYNHLTEGSNTGEAFSLGALAGWQWFPGDEFAIGLGIGADYYIASQDTDEYDGWLPAIRFDIGYAW